jgi:hypothetical protein
MSGLNSKNTQINIYKGGDVKKQKNVEISTKQVYENSTTLKKTRKEIKK